MQYYNPDNNSSRRWAWLAAGLYGALLAAAKPFGTGRAEAVLDPNLVRK